MYVGTVRIFMVSGQNLICMFPLCTKCIIYAIKKSSFKLNDELYFQSETFLITKRKYVCMCVCVCAYTLRVQQFTF